MTDAWPQLINMAVTSLVSVVVTGVFLRRWQYREEFVEQQINELIKEVDAAADLAECYWKRKPSVSEDEQADDEALASKLISYQTRIARMRTGVGDLLDQKCMVNLFSSEGDLFRAFTGGKFREHSRSPDKNRFSFIRDGATSYISIIRVARRKRIEQCIIRTLWH